MKEKFISLVIVFQPKNRHTTTKVSNTLLTTRTHIHTMSSVLATVLLAKANKPASRAWRPRRFRTPVVDNRPEPKKAAKSILKRSFTLVPCNPAWLPEVGLHLAVPLEPVVPKKRVWFPEDTAGEPHPKNPDDGCGGAKYKLTAIREFPKFVPNEDEKKAKNLALGNIYFLILKEGWVHGQSTYH